MRKKYAYFHSIPLLLFRRSVHAEKIVVCWSELLFFVDNRKIIMISNVDKKNLLSAHFISAFNGERNCQLKSCHFTQPK